MTPLLSFNEGEECGGPQSLDFGLDPISEQQKCPASGDLAWNTLQNTSSAPEEFPEWNSSPSLLLNEETTSSALRGRLLQLEASPGIEQGTPSEVSSSRNSILFRHHGEGAYEPRAPQTLHAQVPASNIQQLPSEDAMELSDAIPQTGIDRHSVAQRPSTEFPTWEFERPCRPNPNSNHDMALFMSSWRRDFLAGSAVSPINERVGAVRQMPRLPMITKQRLADVDHDMQGVDWNLFGTSSLEAKVMRSRYHQHEHIRGPHPLPRHARRLRCSENIFSFQQTNTVARPWIEHYQLRNLVATTSSNDLHFVSRSKVMSIGPSSSQPLCVMNLDTSTNPSNAASDFHITALASTSTTLIAGGFRGQYAVQDLLSDFGTEPITGYVSHHPQAITNHIHSMHSRTNGQPKAVFCSNDHYVRTLDVATLSTVASVGYDEVMNCAATSPNGRLRVLVGDLEGALITDADSGRILEHANGGSRGHGFACAWADNDIHVATGGQDCQVLVWDARNWSTPLAAIATENTYPSSLRFSPVGGGGPLLIIAEAADTVSIVNATTYSTKQDIEFFGDVAGTAISEDGSQLVIANGDRHLGGLMTYHRSDFGSMGLWSSSRYASGGEGLGRVLMQQQRSDWLPECELNSHPRVRLHAKARRRRGLRLDDILF